MKTKFDMNRFLKELNIGNIEYLIYNNFKKVNNNPEEKISLPSNLKQDILKMLIPTLGDWLYFRTSVFPQLIAQVTTWDTPINKIKNIHSRIPPLGTVSSSDIANITAELYKLIGFYLGHKRTQGSFMGSLTADCDYKYGMAAIVIRYHDFIAQYKCKQITLDASKVYNLKDQIIVVSEKDLINVFITDELTTQDINQALITNILYRENNNKELLNMVFYNPITGIVYSINRVNINPIGVNGLENEILKERRSNLIKNYEVGDKICLVDFTKTAKDKHTYIIKKDRGIVYCGEKDTTKILGFCTQPGIWWVEGDIFIEDKLLEKWETFGASPEEIKQHRDICAYYNRF